MNLPDLEALAEPHRPADPADLRIRWQCRGCPWWYVQPGTRGVTTARLSSTDLRTRETDGGSGRAALILVGRHVSEAHPLTFRELATSGRTPAEVWASAAAGPCGRGCGGDTHDGAPDSCPGHTAA